eukprot:Awhi_evm1s14319
MSQFNPLSGTCDTKPVAHPKNLRSVISCPNNAVSPRLRHMSMDNLHSMSPSPKKNLQKSESQSTTAIHDFDVTKKVAYKRRLAPQGMRDSNSNSSFFGLPQGVDNKSKLSKNNLTLFNKRMGLGQRSASTGISGIEDSNHKVERRLSTNTLDIRKSIPCKMHDGGRSICPFGNDCFYSHEDCSGFTKVKAGKRFSSSSVADTEINMSEFTMGLGGSSPLVNVESPHGSKLQQKGNIMDFSNFPTTPSPSVSPFGGPFMSDEPSRATSSLSSPSQTKTVRGKSKSPCKNFKNGTGYCEYGDTCLFSHNIKHTAFHSFSADILDEFILPTTPKSKKSSPFSMAPMSPRIREISGAIKIDKSGEHSDTESIGGSYPKGSPATSSLNSFSLLALGDSNDDNSISDSSMHDDDDDDTFYDSLGIHIDDDNNTDSTTEEGELAELGSTAYSSKQIPCRNFDFGKGSCPFGSRCHFGHFLEDGTDVEPPSTIPVSPSTYMLFQNPYGEGDICAAGVIPYIRKKNKSKVWALLQVEDMFMEETQTWEPAIAMFGGKVSPGDKSWIGTAAREFSEETGELLGQVDTDIPAKMQVFKVGEKREAKRYCSYVAGSKYQVLYYPIEKADYQRVLDCPGKYTSQFKGKVDEANWSRSAMRVIGVNLYISKDGGWAVKYNSKVPPRCKVTLESALKLASFPENEE